MPLIGFGRKDTHNNTRTNNLKNIKKQIQNLQYAVQYLKENVRAIKNGKGKNNRPNGSR
jgi:hypothetical protein